MDKASWGGVVLGLGGIVGGLLLEGGSISQILQPTAAMIVFGGTAGAVLLQFPLPVVLSAVRRLAHVFFLPKHNPGGMVQELVRYANRARREGIVSLDSELEKHQGTLPEEVADAGRGWHGAAGIANHDGTRTRQSGRVRRQDTPGIRICWRFFAHHRHHRRGAGSDPGYAAPGQD